MAALLGPIGECDCATCQHGGSCVVGRVWNLRRALEQEVAFRRRLEAAAVGVIEVCLAKQDPYSALAELVAQMPLHEDHDLWAAFLEVYRSKEESLRVLADGRGSL